MLLVSEASSDLFVGACEAKAPLRCSDTVIILYHMMTMWSKRMIAAGQSWHHCWCAGDKWPQIVWQSSPYNCRTNKCPVCADVRSMCWAFLRACVLVQWMCVWKKSWIFAPNGLCNVKVVSMYMKSTLSPLWAQKMGFCVLSVCFLCAFSGLFVCIKKGNTEISLNVPFIVYHVLFTTTSYNRLYIRLSCNSLRFW